MKTILIQVGKTEEPFLIEGISIYEKRIKHYLQYQSITIPAIKNAKNLSEDQQKEVEADLILKNISESDFLILLDEQGDQFRSVEFADFMQKKMNTGLKNLIFVIGGPYGFSKQIYSRANFKISLSKLTFSHQMIRLLFMEQIYRAMTILRNEPYHHE
ncbi:MAG: 23S rRNA (pseudouridine(1915)-N(3))-methyltransferase RlmH [Bacteroidetes bacterium]|nr:23S rRNA (pseudouridine(1915)-N(3))-methyltransferase RlmH [Bacteroidota bacterium]